MATEDPSLPSNLPRSTSVLSRFNEHLNESSESSCLERTLPGRVDCRSCPTRIVHLLKAERRRRKKYLKHVQHKLKVKVENKYHEQRHQRTPSATELAYQRQRDLARQNVERHQAAKKARQEHEKEHKRKSKLKGTMWGYDPMAGRVSESQSREYHIRGCYIFRGAHNDSDEYGVDEIDLLGRRTGRQWLAGTKWGIECGGPGKVPHFECPDVRQVEEAMSPTDLVRRRTQRKSQSPWPQPRSPAS